MAVSRGLRPVEVGERRGEVRLQRTKKDRVAAHVGVKTLRRGAVGALQVLSWHAAGKSDGQRSAGFVHELARW